MNLNSVSAFLGLRANASPTSTNVTNDVQIGVSAQQIAFPTANVAYSVRIILAASGDEAVIDLTDNDTTGSDAWTAGTAQVETATAEGTISGAGNANVVVTSAGMTGSPITVNVAVAASDTATVWAGKVRTALAANTVIAARFAVSGASTAIILTRRPTTSIPVGSTTVDILPGNDTTLNIALDNGTSTGITPAATSANTTTGVATTGARIFDGDGKDWEGNTLPEIVELQAMLFQCSSGGGYFSDANEDNVFDFASGYKTPVLCSSSNLLGVCTITAASAATDITITVIGQTA
jgi:hypothetical protein